MSGFSDAEVAQAVAERRNAYLAELLDTVPCYHPLSCRKCFAGRGACGWHVAGEDGHEDCTGTAVGAR